MDSDSFFIQIKTGDFNEDIANDVEKWFDTSKVKMIKGRFQQVKTRKKKVFFKDELGRNIMIDLLDLKQKHVHTYWMMQ